jgi:phosphatidylserine/phosphatidylglycerophosphate/cardiolipin synthase-like enzyme
VSQDELLARIGEIARRLPPGQVASLADALDDCEAPTPEVKSRAVGAVPSRAVAEVARRLVRAWESEGGVDGSTLAVAIRAASRAVEEERAEESIEIVWTGPRTSAVPVRLTREVLIDVIRASRESLFVVSFAAYRVDVVLTELAAAAERGVVIRLILESGEAEGGTLTFGAAKAFEALAKGVSFYAWPTEQRPVLDRGRASLHAKAAVADDHTALVTSANLTGHGIAENMELGLLVRGGPIPRRLSDHLRELIERGTLVEVLR